MPSGEWVRKAFARAEPGMVRNAIEDVISTQVAKLQKYGIMMGHHHSNRQASDTTV